MRVGKYESYGEKECSSGRLRSWSIQLYTKKTASSRKILRLESGQLNLIYNCDD